MGKNSKAKDVAGHGQSPERSRNGPPRQPAGRRSSDEAQDRAIEKHVSQEKIEANRRNALRSTGPKTPEGKAAVKWNALKHGILAKEIVIPAGEGKESRAEFDALLVHLREYYQPEGIMEEMLVEQIAVCYWRRRRVLRCEIGEIRTELDPAECRDMFEREEDFKLAKKVPSHKRLTKTSRGLTYLLEVLHEVRTEVEEVGYVSDEVKDRLVEAFGEDEGELTDLCMGWSEAAGEGPGEPTPEADTASPEQCKKMILKLLDEEKAELARRKCLVERIERFEMEAKLASLALPSGEAIDKILRYEATVDRQLYRAMTQLERLQTRRRGEPVPPQLSVEVSSEV